MPGDEVRPVLYIPTGQTFDLEQVSEPMYRILKSLRGEIGRGDNVLKCLSTGGDPWLLVYRHESGDYLARHFPGGGHGGDHAIVPESDEHKRVKDYSVGGLERRGLPAGKEVTTDNHTRLDVATLDAPRIVAVEAQIRLPVPELKRRTTLSMRATAFTGKYARPLPDGVLPVWVLPFGIPEAGWGYEVPSIAAQDTSWDILPKPDSVTTIGVRRIGAEKCRIGSRWYTCPRDHRGHCGGTHPLAILRTGLTLDDVPAMAAAGQLLPLRYYTLAIYLVDPESYALYHELGGQGGYAAGVPRVGDHKLGPCRNYQHEIPAPRATRHDPPDLAIEPRNTNGRDWAKVLVESARSEPSVAPALSQIVWRCVRCSTASSSDPCPSCGSWRVTRVREYRNLRRRNPPPGTCHGNGCNARPPGGAEYCQACRLINAGRGELAHGETELGVHQGRRAAAEPPQARRSDLPLEVDPDRAVGSLRAVPHRRLRP